MVQAPPALVMGNPTMGNQIQPRNRHSNAVNPLNANDQAKAMRRNLPGTGGANKHPQNVNHGHNRQQTNAAVKLNPLQATPTFNLQDHHYAYHQKIHRHLNPMPNPLHPPPNAGGYIANGPPPPAHTAAPHTAAPIAPATNRMFPNHHSLPLPPHSQQTHKPSTSKVTGTATVGNPGTNFMHNLQPAKNIPGQIGVPGTSGIGLPIGGNNSGNGRNNTQSHNTHHISTSTQPLPRSKSTSR